MLRKRFGRPKAVFFVLMSSFDLPYSSTYRGLPSILFCQRAIYKAVHFGYISIATLL